MRIDLGLRGIECAFESAMGLRHRPHTVSASQSAQEQSDSDRPSPEPWIGWDLQRGPHRRDSLDLLALQCGLAPASVSVLELAPPPMTVSRGRTPRRVGTRTARRSRHSVELALSPMALSRGRSPWQVGTQAARRSRHPARAAPATDGAPVLVLGVPAEG